MALTSGTKLGPYEIQTSIGAGGMGEVYRAHDSRLDRTVAIKVLPASFSADRDRLQRIAQEARAAAALNHPNILSIFDIGDEDGAPYVVSELLEGETLRDRLRSGPISSRKTIDYAVQVARGLSAAHEKGIVHRDLKPENLFVTNDGRVKILDFGIAKLVRPSGVEEGAAETAVPTETESGAILGTSGYMSPEQIRGEKVDHRSDLFALGCVLYEMLSGRRPFSGPTPADTMSAVLSQEPPPLPTLRKDIPPDLDRAVRRCLEKSAGERTHSAWDLASELERLGGTGFAVAAEPPRRGPRGLHPLSRRVAPREPVGQPGAGVLRRWHDGGAHHDPRTDGRAEDRLADLLHEVQGHEEESPRSRPRARCRCGGGGLRAARREPG